MNSVHLSDYLLVLKLKEKSWTKLYTSKQIPKMILDPASIILSTTEHRISFDFYFQNTNQIRYAENLGSQFQ